MFRTFSTALAATLAASVFAAAALAGDIVVHDAYARTANQKTGAAFMLIENAGAADDRLIGAHSDMARKVELHGHVITDGIARMRPVKGGVALPAHGDAVLQRGGYHVMFMGLQKPFEQGKSFPLTLVFENAGEMVVDVIVDNKRKPRAGAMSGQGGKAMKMDMKTDG